ncbi:hypothetical protein COT51_00065 [candidate division WWE3 bacterium CG08_land_8_20_14_0_20_41_15]|uniref:Uncharacterized protein n=1 Tax=candidate division WWE3 bacterium CG08_land_8_20_14_0_20_41_15 TaxID=1975086 RepID=A0A2H0XAJ7_UNCKA|nr:MAG: hypothetical protein COT51_00065 [candidate division WWE3 bacterium CG08_land_8_20_14_0_20_41_15]
MLKATTFLAVDGANSCRFVGSVKLTNEFAKLDGSHGRLPVEDVTNFNKNRKGGSWATIIIIIIIITTITTGLIFLSF